MPSSIREKIAIPMDAGACHAVARAFGLTGGIPQGPSSTHARRADFAPPFMAGASTRSTGPSRALSTGSAVGVSFRSGLSASRLALGAVVDPHYLTAAVLADPWGLRAFYPETDDKEVFSRLDTDDGCRVAADLTTHRADAILPHLGMTVIAAAAHGRA